MDKSTILTKLREHETELKAAGIEHLLLHGSYARGTAVREVSDVDVIAEFSFERRLSLLDMVAIENRLAYLLGARVDLSPAKGLKEPVAAKASREAELAF
jgi:predicted nucleotidyltransferase